MRIDGMRNVIIFNVTFYINAIRSFPIIIKNGHNTSLSGWIKCEYSGGGGSLLLAMDKPFHNKSACYSFAHTFLMIIMISIYQPIRA